MSYSPVSPTKLTVSKVSSVSIEAKKDIAELKYKIGAFKEGKMHEEKFRAYRLTRGVYGQRQLGVQMFRTKIPFGRITADQLIRLADISEKYTHGNLHLTTRQNIQLHYVKLEDSPAIWEEMAEVGLTAREACGNTVRNLTGSAKAGIDPDEPFDVSPYVYEAFRYFLRNPICQDMGRKIKPAFSSSEKDSAFAYIHDFGFIPQVRTENGEEKRGFKLLVGGGLGAQSIVAKQVYDFLPEDQVIPFMEAAIRVFDRYGERAKRFKARMKFLIKSLGLDAFMELVEKERKALKSKSYKIDRNIVPISNLAPERDVPEVEVDEAKYQLWRETNVFEQKQQGYYAVQVRILLGDIKAPEARAFAALVKDWASDDMRLTVDQGILLRFVRPEALKYLYYELDKLGLAAPGFNSIANITACPGTDTCNLGVSNSTGLAKKLENVIHEEYPHLLKENQIRIKISGCMNSCGQHMIANIGFHGSSIKKGKRLAPAMQLVLGGGVDPSGKGFIAEKVIKIPTKRVPEALRWILDEYENNALEGEYFNDYFRRQGKRYFYALIKPLTNLEHATDEEFQDWEQDYEYRQAIGVGECAGVSYDMVASIITDADERLTSARESLDENDAANSIYQSYSALVIGAKALLLAKDIACNTQMGIIQDFDKHYIATSEFVVDTTFQDLVLQINQNEPDTAFAHDYYQQAAAFLQQVEHIRTEQLKENTEKVVIDNYYKA